METGRDVWVYNFSSAALVDGVTRMVQFFNEQVEALYPRLQSAGSRPARIEAAKRLVDRSPDRFSWTNGAFSMLANGAAMNVSKQAMRRGLYRPFTMQAVAFDSTYVQQINGLDEFYPVDQSPNSSISVVGSGNTVPFGCLATDTPPQLHAIGASSATPTFARWRYLDAGDGGMFDPAAPRMSNISQVMVASLRGRHGSDVDDDAVFSYVYGILHSPDFRSTFSVNLKKEPPRIPLVADRVLFDAFRVAGQDLLDLHIGYESVDPYPLVEHWASGAGSDNDPKVLLVGSSKMKHPKMVDPKSGEKVDDTSQLIYNSHLVLSGIPDEAYRYEVGTRSAIGWLIDRYYVSTDKASGIVNDPNQWGLERGEPRYIIDLIKRVVTVSVCTVEIVDSLPRLTFGDDGVASLAP